jgi:tetratricopeptide (TPR) repeat protein
MSDCALYYGWYAGNVAGPFNQPGFKFVPGAIAVHIHSYSAATLRDETSGWAGPLVSRGAAATVGNVYEPYLELTAHLDILNDRLLHGFTFAESVFMSSRALSWMGVAVGDPLYRPYVNWTQIDSKAPPKSADGWRAYHDFAIKNGKLEPSNYRAQARIAAARARNAIMLEDVGLMELRDGKFANAIAGLEQARGAYSKRDDVIRCVLEECDALIKSGQPNRALDLVRRVLRIIPESPAVQLLHKMESDLTPKPPPQPPPTPY